MLIKIRKKSEAFRTGKTFILPTCSPGPGAYIPEVIEKNSMPAFSIGKSKRYEKFSKSSVGPGSYTPCVRHSSKSAIFGTSPKKCLEILSTTPGPGRYESAKVKTGPEFTLIGKREESRKILTPGPGRYDPNPHYDGHTVKFPQDKRKFIVQERSPGPATYNIPSSSSKGSIVFPKQSKIQTKFEQTPGPGSYNTLVPGSSPKASMKFRHRIKKEDVSPGPARYDPRQETDKNSSFTIGKSKRFIETQKSLPGPGSYNSKVLRSSSAIFGTSKKVSYFKGNDTPGPGEYQSKDCMGEGPSFSIRIKKTFIEPFVSPGPGSYNTETTGAAKGVVFGKSKSRDFLRIHNTTGPGDYNISSIKDHHGWSFSSQSRGFELGSKL